MFDIYIGLVKYFSHFSIFIFDTLDILLKWTIDIELNFLVITSCWTSVADAYRTATIEFSIMSGLIMWIFALINDRISLLGFIKCMIKSVHHNSILNTKQVKVSLIFENSNQSFFFIFNHIFHSWAVIYSSYYFDIYFPIYQLIQQHRVLPSLSIEVVDNNIFFQGQSVPQYLMNL